MLLERYRGAQGPGAPPPGYGHPSAARASRPRGGESTRPALPLARRSKQQPAATPSYTVSPAGQRLKRSRPAVGAAQAVGRHKKPRRGLGGHQRGHREVKHGVWPVQGHPRVSIFEISHASGFCDLSTGFRRPPGRGSATGRAPVDAAGSLAQAQSCYDVRFGPNFGGHSSTDPEARLHHQNRHISSTVEPTESGLTRRFRQALRGKPFLTPLRSLHDGPTLGFLVIENHRRGFGGLRKIDRLAQHRRSRLTLRPSQGRG